MNTSISVAKKLSKASSENKFDYSLDFPQFLEQDQWFFSPELISIYGTEVYDSLSETERKRLSFYEAVNFFSLNVHGEKALIAGLDKRLHLEQNGISSYLHHFLHEENRHLFYFSKFCLQYAGKIYSDRKFVFPRTYEPGEEDFLFFAQVLIFEEIVNVYNRKMAKDKRLTEIVRQINLFHHREEVRHLIFGRHIVKELFTQYSPLWSVETRQNIQKHLQDYYLLTWGEYYNPDVYRDVDLRDAFAIREQALNHPNCQKHRQEIGDQCLRYFNKCLNKIN